MNRKAFFLLSLPLILASCGGTTPASSSAGPDSKWEPKSEPGSSSSSSSQSSEDPYKGVENLDGIAYAKSKMGSADLSFNFALGDEQPAAKSRAPRKNASHTVDADGNYHVEIPFDELPINDNGNFFQDKKEQLKTVSEFARAIVDFAIDNLTVLNKVVTFENGEKYILDLDVESNVVTAVKIGTSGSINAASFYVDEDGNETVDYTESGYGSTYHYVYAPNAYYAIESSSGEYQSQIAAKNTKDGWRGISYSASLNSPWITKEGTYDYSSNMVGIEFLGEVNGAFCTFYDRLIAYRDGRETYSNVVAEEDDIIAPKPYSFTAPFGGIVYGAVASGNVYTTDLSCLKGIASVSFEASSADLIPDEPDTLMGYLQDKRAVFTTDRGETFSPGDIWSEQYGWLKQDDQTEWTGELVDKDGNRHTRDIKSYDHPAVTLENAQYNYDLKGDRMYGSPWCQISVSDDSDVTGTLLAFEQATGIGASTRFGENVVENAHAIEANKDAMRGGLYRSMFHEAYSTESIVNGILTVRDSMAERVSSLNGLIESLPSINRSEMPKAFDAPVLLSLSPSGGPASVSATSVDLTGIEVTCPDSVLFKNGEKYALYATFDGATYAKCSADVSYGGSLRLSGSTADLPLPGEGRHSLSIVLGKVKDDAFVPVSNPSLVPVSVATPFAIEEEFDKVYGGHNRLDYSVDSGSLVVAASFVDEEGPTVIVRKKEVSSGSTFDFRSEETLTIRELLSECEFRDNVDKTGDLQVYVTFEGSEERIALDDLVDFDTEVAYLIHAMDLSGNASEVRINPVRA